MTKEDFFVGLPPRKAVVRTGYCEPPAGDPYSSVVVHLDVDCRQCGFLLCHMFCAIVNDEGIIIGREFIPHNPEY